MFHRSCLALGLLLGLSQVYANSPVTPGIVGEITTVIGQGKVLSGNERQPAARGQYIRAGDRIETAAGGHVHVRFIDGGLVSVRPMSRLLIEDYRDSSTSSLAAIKFKLEDGIMRSVTGQWGEAHRDRFRLNTPVAAIGVKGTDFVVKANGSSTYASVNSGAIIMAPLQGICASALGPCQGEQAVLLSADMHGTMLEYMQQNGSGTPRLVPAVDLQAYQTDATRMAQRRQPDAAHPISAVEKPHISDTVATSQIRESVASISDTVATSQVKDIVVIPSKPMVWLHNTLGWNVPERTISERFDQARVAGRTPVIGNFFINLYRDEAIQKDFLPLASTAALQLTSASANFTQSMASGRPVEIVQISNPSLNVDFARGTLATSMNLSSPSLGQDTYAAAASITAKGYFTSNNAGQNLAGAFSTDGTQAGYLFDKTVNGGKVSGLTLWGR
jgi:hypothetical protein